MSEIRTGSRARIVRLPGHLLPILLALACADQERIAVVDVQQAFQRSPLVMVSAHQIKGDMGASQRELKQRGRALAELRMQVEHGQLELDEQQRQQAKARIAAETASLLEAQRLYRTDLEAAQRRRGEELLAQVEEVAREVAQRQGLTLLLRRQDGLYTEDGALYEGEPADAETVDLTEQVARDLLERINPPEIPRTPDEG